MLLQRLKTFCFRNLRDGEYEIHPNLTVVVGKNGQGKTNFLEAIHFLSVAKSFRASRATQLIRWDQESFSVFGSVQYQDGSGELGVSLQNGRRRAYLNGDPVKTLQSYMGKLVTVLFTPQTLMLVQGAPSERRQFLDRYLCLIHPKYFSSLVRYNDALKHKSRLLKDENCTRQAIEVWNQILAEEAVAITKIRNEFVQSLSRSSARVFSLFSPEVESLEIQLESQFISNEIPFTFEETLRSLNDRFRQEAAARQCLIGVHRDDLNLMLSERDARSFASQGQGRSIALSLVLGVIDLIVEKTGDYPLVLLDDVTSELDTRRKVLFLELLLGLSSQVILTGTEIDSELSERVSGREYLKILVEAGELTEECFSR